MTQLLQIQTWRSIKAAFIVFLRCLVFPSILLYKDLRLIGCKSHPFLHFVKGLLWKGFSGVRILSFQYPHGYHKNTIWLALHKRINLCHFLGIYSFGEIENLIKFSFLQYVLQQLISKDMKPAHHQISLASQHNKHWCMFAPDNNVTLRSD